MAVQRNRVCDLGLVATCFGQAVYKVVLFVHIAWGVGVGLAMSPNLLMSKLSWLLFGSSEANMMLLTGHLVLIVYSLSKVNVCMLLSIYGFDMQIYL